MGNKFSTVLIIDDKAMDEPAVANLVEALNSQYCFPRVAKPQDLNARLIASDHVDGIDLVVLDWQLSPTDDNGHQAIPWARMFTHNAVPVVIYTGQDKVNDAKTVVSTEIPGDLIKVIAKEQAATALAEIQSHLETNCDFAVRVGLIWKPAVREAAQATLRDIREISAEGIQLLRSSAGIDTLDVAESLTELFQNVLTGRISGHSADVRNAVDQIFGGLPATDDAGEPGGTTAPAIKDEEYNQLVDTLQLLTYDKTKKHRTDTGDVIKVPDGYGLVITPRCNLAHANDDTPVTYLAAVPALTYGFEKEADITKFLKATWAQPDEHPNRYGLHDVPLDTGVNQTFVVDYRRVHTVKAREADQRIARVRNPYLGTIINGFVRYILRQGTPSLPYRGATLGALAGAKIARLKAALTQHSAENG